MFVLPHQSFIEAMNAPEQVSKSHEKLSFDWIDPLLLEQQLSEDERMRARN
jgi:hypothetical protein